jgi:hypothetical protein
MHVVSGKRGAVDRQCYQTVWKRTWDITEACAIPGWGAAGEREEGWQAQLALRCAGTGRHAAAQRRTGTHAPRIPLYRRARGGGNGIGCGLGAGPGAEPGVQAAMLCVAGPGGAYGGRGEGGGQPGCGPGQLAPWTPAECECSPAAGCGGYCCGTHRGGGSCGGLCCGAAGADARGARRCPAPSAGTAAASGKRTAAGTDREPRPSVPPPCGPPDACAW